MLRRNRHCGLMNIRQRGTLIVAAIAVTLAACTDIQPLQTSTPLTLSPTPTAIVLPNTPTPTSAPPTSAATAPAATPAPSIRRPTGPILSTPDIVDAVRHSVVQIAVTVPGAPRPSVGTGIIFDDLGNVLTNYHVVARAEAIKVSLWNGEVMTAQLFREDPRNDLAIIKIEADSLMPAVFGDSNALRVGEDVIAVGHALGLEGGPTVSKGVISALDRAIVSSSGRQLSGLIQTDAAINEGNSGGPLVNVHGEVVGLNSVKMGIGEGVGFALNINSVLENAERLISLGAPPPPGYFGAYGLDIRRALAAVLGLPVSAGFGVTEIDPGSPADLAGIRVDDIVVQANDTAIQGGADLNNFLRLHTAGEEVQFTVIRGNKLQGFNLHRFEVVLGNSPGV